MRGQVRAISQPAYEPVSVAEARDWCRLGSVTDHDSVLATLIKTMRRKAENLTGRAFMQRPMQLVLPCWPYDCEYGSKIDLYPAPLYLVSSVTYVDFLGGSVLTLDEDQYVVHNWCEPGFIVPAYQVIWPTVRNVPDAIRVNFVAGYPAEGSPSDESAQQAGIPETLKTWMELNLATLFENREVILPTAMAGEMPRTLADGLLDELIMAERVI